MTNDAASKPTSSSVGDFLKRPLPYVFSRFVKLLANIFKQFFRLHLWIFPDKRFQIPAHGPPLIRTRKPSHIPRVIWQTNYTDKVSLAVYFNRLVNRLLAPTFEFRFVSDEEREEFVRANYPDNVLATFQSLQIGVAQADYWRILVLLKEGGVYMDIDANLVWPLEWTLDGSLSELFITDGGGHVTNSFLATIPGNRIFEETEAQIRNNIADPSPSSIFMMTGPGALWPVLEKADYSVTSYRTVSHQGQFINTALQYPDKSKKKWWEEEKERPVRK